MPDRPSTQPNHVRRRTVLVYGPAYLDRVLRVDRPLVDPSLGPPLDQSVDGRWEGGPGLTLTDPAGGSIVVDLPEGWPGPTGLVRLSRPMVDGAGGWERAVRGLGWHDDLGGMGAGFAAAFRGELISAVGAGGDPTSRAVAERLRREGIEHRPIFVPDRPADWTLLVTSAGFGDKLPIGFRGCHAALDSLGPWADRPCDLRVVAGLPNRVAAQALRAPGARVRFFAPAARNMMDRVDPLPRFAGAIDLLSCNRREWESLPDRQAVVEEVPIVAITDGPLGSVVHFRDEEGRAAEVRVGAFPREHPPRDTNRAGEAFASTLVSTLLDAGWTPGPAAEALVLRAALRASAAAALVLDRTGFGFPGPEAIDAALRAGRVAGDEPIDLR